MIPKNSAGGAVGGARCAQASKIVCSATVSGSA
jgi:hypothetical protein